MRKIAVVGIEGGIGREVLNLLAEQGVGSADVAALEARSALGNTLSYGEEDEIDVLGLDNFDFAQVKTVVFAGSAELTKRYMAQAQKAGVKIIDASGYSIGNPDVPMILAGVNDDCLDKSHGMAAVPSAGTAQLLLPLRAVAQKYRIKRLVVSTYASASAYGRAGMDELFNQTRKIFMNETLADDQTVFHKQIAFNVIPHLGDFIGEETSAEWAFNAETKQILGGDVKVHANCAVVPAFVGMAMYVNVECEHEIDADEARAEIKKTKGVVVFDKQTDGGYVTLHDTQGEDGVYVSRLRQDTSVDNGISFWCAADAERAAGARNIIEVWKLLTTK